jgi:hypothetical protein
MALGFAQSIELLAKLLAVSCPKREVPVNSSDIKRSKVSLLRVGLKLFCVALHGGWIKKAYESRARLGRMLRT